MEQYKLPDRTVFVFDGREVIDEWMMDGSLCPNCNAKLFNVISYPEYTIYCHPTMENPHHNNDYCIVQTYQENLPYAYQHLRLQILGPHSVFFDNSTWQGGRNNVYD